jgi:hypothetical protein
MHSGKVIIFMKNSRGAKESMDLIVKPVSSNIEMVCNALQIYYNRLL